MKIILASSNLGKLREFKSLLSDYEILNYSEILPSFDIEENGTSFASNASIKARAVFNAIKQTKPQILKNSCILSDDSGISVQALHNQPGIFSARYSADIVQNPSEKSNRAKLIKKLNELDLKITCAFYTAAICVINENFGEFLVHGFMFGEVIDEERGEQGFGYDFMFIPKGFTKTIGELNPQIKEQISHRSKAINNILPVLQMIQKRLKNCDK